MFTSTKLFTEDEMIAFIQASTLEVAKEQDTTEDELMVNIIGARITASIRTHLASIREKTKGDKE